MEKKGRERVHFLRTTNNPHAYVDGRVAGSQPHDSFPNYHDSKTITLIKTKVNQVKE